MPCPTVKSSFDYRFLAMVITQQFTELFHGHSNQYSTEKISHSQTNIKSLNASILLKLRTVKKNNASNLQIYRILGKYIIAAQREFIFTQLHHISLTNHKFPSRYLVRKSSPSKMHSLFCHLFSVILYEDRSVCAVNVMHKKCFFFCNSMN